MDSNKCWTYQFATGRITAIISWLGHRFKDTRRHRQERVQTEPRQDSRSKRFFSQIGSSFASQPRRPSLLSWLSSIGGGTLGSADLFIVRYPTVELWKEEMWRKKIPGLMVYLCEGERFLVVEEEIVLLLLVIFPYRASVQKLGHLIV